MPGISLSKGQRVSLEKADGGALKSVCIGLNWGAIPSGGILGFGGGTKAVDLDASVGLYNKDGRLTEKVFFGKLKSSDGSIVHSGDDRVGDTDGDDGLDNEVIVLNLESIPESTAQIAFVLDSYNNIKFDKIPHAALRVYEGTPDRVDNVLAEYNIANDSEFSGAISMIMGKVYRHNGAWKFNAIGQATNASNLDGTLKIFEQAHM